MKAHAQSLRIAPKKANLIAKMVRGMSVPDAMEALRRTNKKAARMVELLLRSAIANASHNDKQDAQMLIVKTIVVNQGTSYRRGIPRARGSMRPIRKFLSHISLTLGFAADEAEGKEGKKEKKLMELKKSKSDTSSKKGSAKQSTPSSHSSISSNSSTSS